MYSGRLNLLCFASALLLLSCARSVQETQSKVVGEAEQNLVATDLREGLGPDGRIPLQPSRLSAETLGLTGLEGVEGEGLEWLVAVLNQTRAPCRPCMDEGASIATCLGQQAPGCANLSALLERALAQTRASVPAEEIRASLQYAEPWQPVATRLGLSDPSLVLALDYEDPFTQRYHSTWKALREAKGEGLSLGLLHLPQERHPRARSAALAVLAAERQGRAWVYQDHLVEMNSDLSDLALFQLADRLGLDSDQWKTDVLGDELEAELETHLAMAVEFEVQGTPVVFVNGYGVSGERDLEFLLGLFQRDDPPPVP